MSGYCIATRTAPWLMVALCLPAPQPRVRADDCNRNGLDDSTEIAAGDVPDCNANLMPDACDLGPVLAFTPEDLPLEDSPGFLVASDFNADGRQDLAIASDPYAPSSEAVIFILLNEGGGVFGTPVEYSLGVHPGAGSLIADDFNGDGTPDLAASIAYGGGIRLLVNDGTGVMAVAGEYPVGIDLWGINSGDWDGDGDADLAVADYGGHRVFTLLNDGASSFSSGSVILVADQPGYIDVADFNGDSSADIAVGSFGGDAVSVLLNDGFGQFNDRIEFIEVPYTTGLIALDLDADGDADLSTTSCNESVFVFNNFGQGVFRQLMVGSASCEQTRVGDDYDLDGDVDVVNSSWGSSSIYFYENRGDGTLQPDRSFSMGGSESHRAGYGIASGDFDGDGDADLAVSNPDFLKVTLMWNDVYSGEYLPDCDENAVPDECDKLDDCNANGILDVCEDCDQNGQGDSCELDAGDATDCNANTRLDVCDLAPSLEFYLPAIVNGTASEIVSGDLDQDGDADFITADADGVNVRLNNGYADFGDPTLIYDEFLEEVWLFLLDFDGDGSLDLCEVSQDSSFGNLFFGLGDGTFSLPVTFDTGGGGPTGAVVADVDNDGWPDLVTANESSHDVSILINDGTGTLVADVIDFGFNTTVVASGDFDGDGDADLALSFEGLDAVRILLNDGAANFAVTSSFPVFETPLVMATADLNADGFEDLVIGESYVAGQFNSHGGVEVYLSSAEAADFDLAASIVLYYGPKDLRTVDLELDGDADILVVGTDNAGDGALSVITQTGPGILQLASSLKIEDSPVGISFADFDDNGFIDILTANDGGGHLSLVLNLSSPPISTDQNANGVPDECEIPPMCAGDINGDQAVDLLDIGYVMSRLGCAVGGNDEDCGRADVNKDQHVDPLDSGFVLSRLGSCG